MYLNITSQVVTNGSAGKTLTASFTMMNFDAGSLEVSWTGVTGVAGFVQVFGSNTGVNYSTLTVAPATFLTSTSSYLFNVTDAGYNFIKAEYQPSGNTTGTVNMYTTTKSRR